MRLFKTLVLLFCSALLMSQAGTLDTSFGDNGTVITVFENSTARPTGLSVQSDGKILLAGSDFSGSGGENVVVVRYLANGQIDTEYGQGGKFTYNNSDYIVNSSAMDILDNLYLLCFFSRDHEKRKTLVMKISVEGNLDTTFADNGIWISELPEVDEYYKAIALQEDGHILITGTHHNFPEPSTSTIRRLSSTGTIDSLFGNNGSAAVRATGGTNTEFLGLSSKGEIYGGGLTVNLEDPDSSKVFLAKYDSNGLLDTSFGVDGIFESESGINEKATSLYIQDDDKIVLGTRFVTASGVDFGLLRLSEEGSLDASFGTNGRLATNFSEMDRATSVLVQEDGKIILSGSTKINSDFDYAIARYNSDGQLDLSFGDNGKVVTDFGFNDFITTSTLQADGKLLCVGSSGDQQNPISFSLARYRTEDLSSTERLEQQIKNVSVYPNPTNGILNLEFTLYSATIGSIALLSSSGNLVQKLVEAEPLDSGLNSLKLDVGEAIIPGHYILKIETGRGTVTAAVVVE